MSKNPGVVTPRNCDPSVRQAIMQMATNIFGLESTPTFAGLDLGTGELVCGSVNRASGTLTLEIGGTAELSITSTATTLGGNLIIPDGGTVGQAAGPLLTFNDASNLLGISGCKIQVNGSTGTDGTISILPTADNLFLTVRNEANDGHIALFGHSSWDSYIKLRNAAGVDKIYLTANGNSILQGGKVTINGVNTLLPLEVIGPDGVAEGTPGFGTDDVAVFRNNGAAGDLMGLVLMAGTTGTVNIMFGDANDRNPGQIQYDNATDFLSFWTDNAERVVIKDTGEMILLGTARVTRLLNLTLDGFASSPSNTPTRAYVGNTMGYKFDIDDYGYVAPFEVQLDWDSTVQPNLLIHWYSENTTADKLVSWQIDFNTTVEDVGVLNAVTTTVTTGLTDLAVPTTDFLLNEATCTLSGMALEDVVSVKITRVAATGGVGVEPDNDPVVVSLEVEYISNKLGTPTA